MTSLDALGFSITLLKATPETISYVDAPTKAVGWAPSRRLVSPQGNVVQDDPETALSAQEASSGIVRKSPVPS